MSPHQCLGLMSADQLASVRHVEGTHAHQSGIATVTLLHTLGSPSAMLQHHSVSLWRHLCCKSTASTQWEVTICALCSSAGGNHMVGNTTEAL